MNDTDNCERTTKEENGVFAQHGLLTLKHSIKEIYHGPEDIPPEYRVFAYPERDPCIRVENADLSVLLLKMHALGGAYMQDAQYNLNILAQKKSTDYLLLMNGRNAYLTQAMKTYQRGTTPFNVWLRAEESPETKAYTIHVRDQWSAIIGDIVEVDLNEHQLDILQNSVCCSEVFAKLKDGSEKTFTADEWNSMEDIARDRIESWTECFTSDGMHSVVRHLEELRKEHAAAGKTVEPDDFLSDLNKQYMNAAPYPQSDMLRVYQTVAKDIMARGDATVFSLLPEGMKKLTPIDAVKYGSSLRCPGHLQFAVKKDGLAGIDKWARREIEALNAKRDAERETFAKKSKSRGEEL